MTGLTLKYERESMTVVLPELSENLPRFQFSSQHVRTLEVPEPVQLLKSRRELSDRLDVRELLDSGKRPLIRGPSRIKAASYHLLFQEPS